MVEEVVVELEKVNLDRLVLDFFYFANSPIVIPIAKGIVIGDIATLSGNMVGELKRKLSSDFNVEQNKHGFTATFTDNFGIFRAELTIRVAYTNGVTTVIKNVRLTLR